MSLVFLQQLLLSTFLASTGTPPATSSVSDTARAIDDALSGTARTATRASSTTSSLLDQLDAAASGQTASAPSGQSALNAVVRGFQSLNPDLSAILDITGGYGQRAPLRPSGDDPDLGGGPASHSAGFTIQEAELAVQSIVDPYFRADLFLTIPNLSGIEIEEGYVTTTDLPLDLQLKAGAFRSAFGRQNGQHLHLQDFTRRPLINAAYLGTDGLRPPGLQVSWLVPVPFFLQLNAEAFSVGKPDDLTQISTFGGGTRTDLTYTTQLKAFVPASQTVSIYGGLSAAFGRTPGLTDQSFRDHRSQLYGADLYVKVKPPNQAVTYFSLAWTTEYFYRRIADGSDAVADGGVYTQIVVQVARSWFLGVREDILGIPSSLLQPRVSRTSGSITFAPSEFARVRAYLERELASDSGLSPANNTVAYLQLEVAIGAHGAHPF
jgi:hypothetical protein